MRNIILTGIPRAGTTLAASIIDAEKDSVCLNEPEWQHPHPELDAGDFAQAIMEDFGDVRQKLLAKVPVPDRRAKDGSATTNYYGSGTENNFVEYPLVREGLSEHFTLAIKHNGPYLAVLPQLVALEEFEIRAIIRHPLPVLRSWRRLSLPISRGEMPNATAYWREMRELTVAKIDLLEKQARMFELMFLRIMEQKDAIEIIRYETLAGEAGQMASHATPEDGAIISALEQFAPKALAFYA